MRRVGREPNDGGCALGYGTTGVLAAHIRANPTGADAVHSAFWQGGGELNGSFDVIYDDDTRIFGPDKDAPALQLKSIVGAGFQLRI